MNPQEYMEVFFASMMNATACLMISSLTLCTARPVPMGTEPSLTNSLK